MKLPAYRTVIFLLSLFISHAAIAESCLYGDARAPVQMYTQAMKEYRFNDAYAVLTGNMTDGLTADAWAAGQRKLFELGQVVIGKLDVRWPQHIDEGSCAETALVPNVLSAKDRFNNQGSVEFELYRVVKEAGEWKIDGQETLIEEPQIHRWFPGDVIPEFKDQLPTDELLPGEA